MDIFPVGCIDNGHAVYVHVAAPDAVEAENFVRTNRPYMDIINTFDTIGQYDTEKVQTVKVSTKI